MDDGGRSEQVHDGDNRRRRGAERGHRHVLAAAAHLRGDAEPAVHRHLRLVDSHLPVLQHQAQYDALWRGTHLPTEAQPNCVISGFDNAQGTAFKTGVSAVLATFRRSSWISRTSLGLCFARKGP